MSKQVSLLKISSILRKIKSAQKAIYTLFARKPLIDNSLYSHVFHLILFSVKVTF